MTEATRLLILVGLGRFYLARLFVEFLCNLFEHGRIAHYASALG